MKWMSRFQHLNKTHFTCTSGYYDIMDSNAYWQEAKLTDPLLNSLFHQNHNNSWYNGVYLLIITRQMPTKVSNTFEQFFMWYQMTKGVRNGLIPCQYLWISVRLEERVSLGVWHGRPSLEDLLCGAVQFATATLGWQNQSSGQSTRKIVCGEFWIRAEI